MKSKYLKLLSLSWLFLLLNLLASISLVLVIINVVLTFENQKIQNDINSRQQYINQAIKVSRLNGQVIQTLANVSAQTGDRAIRNLLLSQGISFDIKNTPVMESKE